MLKVVSYFFVTAKYFLQYVINVIFNIFLYDEIKFIRNWICVFFLVHLTYQMAQFDIKYEYEFIC